MVCEALSSKLALGIGPPEPAALVACRFPQEPEHDAANSTSK